MIFGDMGNDLAALIAAPLRPAHTSKKLAENVGTGGSPPRRAAMRDAAC
ncbi:MULTISPECIES: hypothetical protein [Methylobacterium]|nr:hypothetical protein [Methylobacterium sp. DB0501]NGM37150.1 hypothetical protein [Methylobacterium sp. DB0501]